MNMPTPHSSLFHFTNDYVSLEGILFNKFYLSYCREHIYYKERTEYLIVPMISFCDVPLSAVKSINYGKYIIGLSKKWAIEKGLNPVLYIERNSLLAQNFLKSMNGMFQPYKRLCIMEEQLKKLTQLLTQVDNAVGTKMIQEKIGEIKNQRKGIADSLQFTLYSTYFTKHYQDDLNRNGEEIRDYIFYNEREWRYVPEFDTAMFKLKMTDEEYTIWRGDKNVKKPLITEFNLPFSSHDINYIIVSEQEEIKPMINTLEKCIEQGKLVGDKEILFTKIITYKQITDDF